MPTFELTDKSGAVYQVEAPNESVAVAAIGHMSGAVPLQPSEPAAQAPAAPTQGSPSVAADVAKSAGIGVVKGGLGLLGSLGDLTDLGAKGIEKASNFVSDRLGVDRYQRPAAPSILQNIPTAGSLQRGVEGVTGEFYQPKTTAGEYAQTAGEFLPGVIGGPEGIASRLATRVAVPAVASETAGQLTRGTAAEPYARIAGALLAPAASSAAVRGVDALRSPIAGMPRASAEHLIAGVQADGPAAVQARLAALGPDATLADAGPALLGKAQGTALNSDEGRSIMQGALTARNEGTNQRIMSDVNRSLGPAEDPQTVTEAIRAHRSAVDNASYPTALGNAPDVQVSHLMDQINEAMKGTPSGTMERRALENLRNMLTTKEVEGTSASAAVPSGAVNSPAASIDAAANEHAVTVAALRSQYGDAVADAFARQNAPAAAAAAPQAMSLLQFIASKGGLAPHPELDALGLTPGRVALIPERRAYGVLNEKGTNLDRMREAAQEAGYLRSSHPDQTTTTRDFLDAVDNELRGQKTFPAGYEGQQTVRETAARSAREQHEHDQFIQGLKDDLRAAGHDEHSPEIQRRAIDLMASKGMDPDTAIDHAMIQLEREASSAPASGFPGDRQSSPAAPVVAPSEQVVPHTDARVLHKVKQELDNVIEYNAPGLGVPAGALQNQQGTLKHFRGLLNRTLEDQVPGYRSANRVSAALAQRAQAVERGTQYLGSGKTTPSPDRFAAEFGQMSPGEQIAFAKGSRGNIERVLGTKANDLQALRGELQGEGGWNTAKLATVHGQDAANELVSSVDRNLKFRDTYNKVVENSQTAQRTAAAKAMKPDPSTETPLFNPNSTLTGMAATLGKKGVQKVIDAILASDPTKHYGEVARALTEQGSARDARLMSIINAIDSRSALTAATSAPVTAKQALIAAILARQAGGTNARDQRP